MPLTPEEKKKGEKWVLILMAIILVIGTITHQISLRNNSNGSAPITVVDALELIKEYDYGGDNAASEKYSGLLIQTTGVISDIVKPWGDSPYILLEPYPDKNYKNYKKWDGHFYGTTIYCTFASEYDVTSLSEGQRITIQGKFKGSSYWGAGHVYINMENCKIIK